LIAIFGSAGLLEFSINQGNAAASLSLGAGADFWLKVV
jgi:S-adenosylmethionine hydrolase